MSNYLDYAGLAYYKAKSDNKYATKTMVGAPSVAATAAAMTDTSRIYVYTGSESGYTSGNWYYYNGSAWTSGGVYNAVAVQTDTTLTESGMAADSATVGDELDDLKSAIDLGSITPGVKSALLDLLEHVAYIDEDGQDYYDALYDALYNRYWQVTNNLTNCTTSNESVQTIKGAAYTATITASAGYVMTGATVSITMGGNDITATAYSNGVISIPAVTGALVITISAAAKSVVSISAVFTQGDNLVFSVDTLDSLKQYLVVTATYDDSSTAVISEENYTLSGTLTAGASTITATYQSKTTSFAVSVTASTDITPGLDSISTVKSNVGTEVDTQNNTVRIFCNNTGTYRGAYFPFTTTSEKRYRVSADAEITVGEAKCAVTNASNQIISSSPTITTSGHIESDFEHNANIERLFFYCTWTTSALGNVTYKNIRVVEYEV